MYKSSHNIFSHRKIQNVLINNFKKSFVIRYKIDWYHWISYENGVTIIGCTSKGQEFYKEIKKIHFFICGGMSIHLNQALFGVETGYFKDYPIINYFKSPIEGTTEEINSKIDQNPVSLIQSFESDAWLIKLRVTEKNIENYFSLLRETEFNK